MSTKNTDHQNDLECTENLARFVVEELREIRKQTECSFSHCGIEKSVRERLRHLERNVLDYLSRTSGDLDVLQVFGDSSAMDAYRTQTTNKIPSNADLETIRHNAKTGQRLPFVDTESPTVEVPALPASMYVSIDKRDPIENNNSPSENKNVPLRPSFQGLEPIAPLQKLRLKRREDLSRRDQIHEELLDAFSKEELSGKKSK